MIFTSEGFCLPSEQVSVVRVFKSSGKEGMKAQELWSEEETLKDRDWKAERAIWETKTCQSRKEPGCMSLSVLCSYTV